MNRAQTSRRFAGTTGGGFTLIEVMIVVAIIAILAAIAIPSYHAYIIRSNRAAAKACLSQLSNYMERYYATNLRYDQDTSGNPVALPALECRGQIGSSYTLGFAAGSFKGATTTLTAPATNPSTAAYMLQAVPTGTQTQDAKCLTLALDQKGAQGISSGASGGVKDCWGK